MSKRTDPATWLREQDSAMRIMLAEITTSAGQMAEAWNHAIQSADDPDVAMTHLADVEVAAKHLVGFRARLLWRTARRAMRLYDAAETPSGPPARQAPRPPATRRRQPRT